MSTEVGESEVVLLLNCRIESYVKQAIADILAALVTKHKTYSFAEFLSDKIDENLCPTKVCWLAES